MSAGETPNSRRHAGSRHAVDHRAPARHRQLGEFVLHVVNLSAHGFMVAGELTLGRGERVTVRLPGLGQIEAHVSWNSGGRAGFQFERLLRPEQVPLITARMQPD